MPEPPRQLVEAVRTWREARCGEACPQCPINCCAGRLNPRLDDMRAFEALPQVSGRQARPPEPYVLAKRALGRTERFLVGTCPHLSAGRCAIFDDPSRPRECHEYPVSVRRLLGGYAGFVIAAERSCWILQQASHRDSLTELAAAHGVDCMFMEDKT
jgi:Fe-S-cluster containining protein